MKRKIYLLNSIICLILLVACGNDATSDSSKELVIEEVKANLMLPTETGAVYMQITNGTDQDEALLSADVPGCNATELHEMTMDNGVMKMRPVEGGKIPIPAGETVVLKRGGLHVMCLGKTQTYSEGEMVTVTLTFEHAGILEVEAEVFDISAEGGMEEGMEMDHDSSMEE